MDDERVVARGDLELLLSTRDGAPEDEEKQREKRSQRRVGRTTTWASEGFPCVRTRSLEVLR
jgi:hypothetical protein